MEGFDAGGVWSILKYIGRPSGGEEAAHYKKENQQNWAT